MRSLMQRRTSISVRISVPKCYVMELQRLQDRSSRVGIGENTHPSPASLLGKLQDLGPADSCDAITYSARPFLNVDAPENKHLSPVN